MSLSYEDPYTESRPIYWVHQPVKGMKHRMKWCELREYKWNEYVTIAVNRNLSNCEIPRKKLFRASTGFKPMASALALQCSTSLSYEDPYTESRPILLSSSTHEGNETQNEMMWTAGIQMKWMCDHRSESQFKQLQNSLKKRFFGASTGFEPAVHIISFCVSFLSWVDELNKLAGSQCMGLHSSGW